jgi:deazaflavin-dependent oxidoreductase (nitroreductase family)
MGLAAVVQKPFISVHHWLYLRTDGRVGHRLLGVPTLLLRTVGRRSSLERTSALAYASDDGAFYVVPSNGGADRPPAWLLNLQAAPEVEVQIGRRRMRATATVVPRGAPEHADLWTLVNGINRASYERYQRRTDRPIPVVRLAPLDHPARGG